MNNICILILIGIENMRSKYRMGWLVVCFDLPVVEKEDNRQANAFRKALLNMGYFMLQNSIYVRSCVTYDKVEQQTKNIKMISPKTGSIVVFYITDKQWSQTVCIDKFGYNSSKYKKKAGENAEKQMTFW